MLRDFDLNKPLPNGTNIDNYEILSVLGGGGFSVVYLANEIGHKGYSTQVVIKEYMPNKLASRAPNFLVTANSDKNRERFAHGRRLFFQEASTLANLKHPNIVNVTNFFRGNGTVYMVMDYEEGSNLHAYIKKYRKNLSEEFIRTVFMPLMAGLQKIHSQGLLHLDIKPGNIHIRQGGSPLLLDFGAVHEMMHSRQDQTTQVITPGYSPIEQLDPGGYVGPWTDIYALGATMRTCIEGKQPISSINRRERDTLKPAMQAFKKLYTQNLLETIDWAMEVDPLLRPQNLEQIFAKLNSVDWEKEEKQRSKNRFFFL